MPAYTWGMSENEAAPQLTSYPRQVRQLTSATDRGCPASAAYTVHMEAARGPHLSEARALPPLEWAEPGTERADVSRETLAPHSTRVPAPKPGPYNPAELAKALLALLGLLLGLTLALGGWQPHTSDARLGWSHGSISVVEGTDGDTGSRPLSPNDSGVLPADPGGRPVDLPKAYLGDSSRFAPGVSPWAGPVDA